MVGGRSLVWGVTFAVVPPGYWTAGDIEEAGGGRDSSQEQVVSPGLSVRAEEGSADRRR